MQTAKIRRAFLQYFHRMGHTIVPSSSLVPARDPTLLFTNAGMVQFKDVFLGLETRSYVRAVSVQECLRAGGKHNDLNNVGHTARHHTFFEMLGFFSFGDYFKRDAIHFAWNFLIHELKLPASKLWITVYEEDDEAARIWLEEIGVPKDRLSRCGEKDNFWAMGDVGPCGPCTEIFYDHGPEIAGGPPGSPEADGDRYIEIWNLVFMQYNRDKSGQLHPLPNPAVDTGMGLERIAAVMQGVHNNYDIDDFQTLIRAIVQLTPSTDPQHASLKVIADHLRAVAFLVMDGVVPSNDGRGYVLRRIMRRAIRHANQLGIASPFFARLLPALIQVMGSTYTELATKQAYIAEVLTKEEAQFAKTLDQGLHLLTDALEAHQASRVLPGTVAFKLYDTYGFPFDLTEDILREKGWEVDRAVFEKCMEGQRALSQSSSQFAMNQIPLELSEVVVDFQGYEYAEITTTIEAIAVDGVAQEILLQDQKAVLVLRNTPFYAEGGGQVGDTGVILAEDAQFVVTDTQRQGQIIFHQGYVKRGKFVLKQTVAAKIDLVRRNAIRLNHTATHLLQAALKQRLDSGIEQKGSLVEAERARFDFSYPTPLSPEQLEAIEQLVNTKIREDIPATTDMMSIEEAKKSGAIALFGEKYAETVRVLSVGDFSKELCGGTHVKRTGEMGYFKIIAEYGIASGVRRIEIMTGQAAQEWVNKQLHALDKIERALKCSREETVSKVLQLLNDIKDQEKHLAQLRQKLAHASSVDLLKKIEKINGISCLITSVEGADMNALRSTLDALRAQLQEGVVVLYAISGDRINVVVGVTATLLNRVPKAPELAKMVCDKAGGRDEMAQGGGPVPEDWSVRIEKLKQALGHTQ